MATISVKKPHKEVKNARVELKTSTELKETLRQAAQVAGVDLSAFILNAAFERAEEVLENQKRRELDEENWRNLNMLIAEPASPTLALRALMRKNKDGKATK
ncbi:type II toxin-antitoxin system TacA family antitoxin [Xenorhabdus szentirmaii]|uniref:type II toxin-antitoxin system TacA family antitoxin n=1 Tax=Xenorhabdus szentirmaii TaxID=290112 RepID=UPI0019B10A77|nr:DUF1778 domain-containing protein [Xenorhabdus sp. 38]MBD2780666.1 DUF1778 domain-containing protein [Xenorhabdus sp. 38]